MEILMSLMQRQFIKFLFVGGINTVFGFGLFAFLIYIGFHYTIAVLIGTILGVLFNFKTTGKIVFASHDHRLIWKFFGVYSIIYLLNILGLYLLEKVIHNTYISGSILILPLALLSFILNKNYVFARS
jgi:putative flippase GtrA